MTEPGYLVCVCRTAPWLGTVADREWLIELAPDGYGLWSEERADAVELGEVEAVAVVMRLEDYAQRWDMTVFVEPAGLDPVTK